MCRIDSCYEHTTSRVVEGTRMDPGCSGQISDILLDQVEWALVRITDRITWWERCDWIQKNCSVWQDHTDWPLWQIGLSDIEFYVPERDAVIYYLKWL